jgi:hypothetical protein
VRSLGDVDGAIAAHRADAYKAWAAEGGERPALDVPADLAERQRARVAAAEEFAAAQAAHDGLSGERAAAVEAHTRAGDAVFDAAKAVLVEEAGRIAAELDEALRHVFALEDDLQALGMFSAQGRGCGETWAQGRLRLSPAVHNRITTPLAWRPELPGGQSYAGRRLPGWQALFNALQAEADAVK